MLRSQIAAGKGFVFSLTENHKIVARIYVLAHEARVRLQMRYSDEEYAYMRYQSVTGKKLDLDNPKSFDEKEWWLRLYYRNPLMTQCVDKYKVREYVEEKGLGYILNELYGCYRSSSEIDWDKLPNEFFIKTNHGCGCNFHCKDKSSFPIKKVSKILDKNLRQNYYYQSREWPYKNVEPRIIIEKVITPSDGEELADYRFLCFGGECKYVFVDVDTCKEDGHHSVLAKRNVYTRDFRLLPVRVGRDNFDASRIKKPSNYKQMLLAADRLGGEFPFVRVDLYNVSGRVIFGELTFFHAGNVSSFTPDEFAYELGDCLKLPEKFLEEQG